MKPCISIKENIVARSEKTTANDKESRQANLNLAASNRSVVNDVFGFKKLTEANITIVISKQRIGNCSYQVS